MWDRITSLGIGFLYAAALAAMFGPGCRLPLAEGWIWTYSV